MALTLALGGCLGTADPGGGVEGVTSVDDDGANAGEYPAGPYGNMVGEVFPRMTFVSADGAVVDLADDYQGPLRARVLFATTVWCSPCVPDAEYLQAWLLEAHPQSAGLGVLFENASGGTAAAADAQAYNEAVESFTFVADPGRAVHDVFGVAAPLPRVAVLQTDTMQIAYIDTGHDMDAVLQVVGELEG